MWVTTRYAILLNCMPAEMSLTATGVPNALADLVGYRPVAIVISQRQQLSAVDVAVAAGAARGFTVALRPECAAGFQPPFPGDSFPGRQDIRRSHACFAPDLPQSCAYRRMMRYMK
jgi:hypothetical protein